MDARPRAGHRRGRGVQHGGHEPAPRRPVQRRGRACTATVSREMFAGVWPDVPVEEVPIALGHQRRARPHLDLPRDGRPATSAPSATTGPRPRPSAWRGVDDVPDAELWTGAPRPTASASCLRPPPAAPGRAGPGHDRVAGGLDRRGARPRPSLTIGFARRFATYKRADLLLRDVERLKAAAARRGPAGADHLRRQGPPRRRARQGAAPARSPSFAADLDIRHRLVFLEDYDISVARMLVPGVDVWLNTPLRPHGGVRHVAA